MPHDSATPAYVFATPTSVPLHAAFDGGRLTSDGGLPWLAEADTALLGQPISPLVARSACSGSSGQKIIDRDEEPAESSIL